jgi:hypothetical protein
MRKRCLVVVAVLLRGCSLIPRSVPVTEASLVDGDDRRISLTVSTCNAARLAADKVLALFGRAAARDYQDVAALPPSWHQ